MVASLFQEDSRRAEREGNERDLLELVAFSLPTRSRDMSTRSLGEYKVALLRSREVVRRALRALIQSLIFVNNERVTIISETPFFLARLLCVITDESEESRDFRSYEPMLVFGLRHRRE